MSFRKALTVVPGGVELRFPRRATKPITPKAASEERASGQLGCEAIIHNVQVSKIYITEYAILNRDGKGRTVVHNRNLMMGLRRSIFVNPGIDDGFNRCFEVRHISGDEGEAVRFGRRRDERVHRAYRAPCRLATRYYLPPGLRNDGID
jgi:hypothetical protein